MYKNMFRVLIVISMLACLVACGGDEGGMGNTVRVTASAKDGESMLAWIDVVNNDADGNSTPAEASDAVAASKFSYTLTSTVYPGYTGQPVQITGLTLTYTLFEWPSSCTAPQITAAGIPAATYGIGPTLSAGGSTDIDNVNTLFFMPSGITTSPSLGQIGTYKYYVDAVFHGTEATGKNIATNAVRSTLILYRPS